jgi:hypothetical protein
MLKRLMLGFLLGGVLVFSASCSRNEPKDDPQEKTTPVVVKDTPSPSPSPTSPAAKADLREVTVHVDGMTEKYNLI